jgi:uncharacterized membrane protein YoaK (UPF0700 family)
VRPTLPWVSARVLLGLHIGQEQGAAAFRAAVAFVGFGADVAIGALIVERIRSEQPRSRAVTVALAVEAVMLAGFGAGSRQVQRATFPCLLSICPNTRRTKSVV